MNSTSVAAEGARPIPKPHPGDTTNFHFRANEYVDSRNAPNVGQFGRNAILARGVRVSETWPTQSYPIVRLHMPPMTRTIESPLKQSHSGRAKSEAPSESSIPVSNTRSAPIHILRLTQVIERTGLKKTTIYELQSEGQFPMRVKITAHAVGWIEHEVQDWLAGRIAKNNPLRTHGSRA
jgi:prophage regulatory protein